MDPDTAVPRVLADGTLVGYVGSGIDVTDLELAKSSANLSRRLLHEHEQQRAMVARALTDDLCQQLSILMIRLNEFSQAPAGADDGQIRMGVEEVRRQLATLSGEIFAMSEHLRSSKLDNLGLAAATRLRCRELSAVHGVTIDAHDEGVPPYLPEDVSLVLFKVIEEALHNALRHAAARRVTVSLYGGPDEIQLEVADDGVGFDPQTVTMDRSLGLAEMRERLKPGLRRVHDRVKARCRNAGVGVRCARTFTWPFEMRARVGRRRPADGRPLLVRRRPGAANRASDADWPTHRRDPAGTGYSPLRQINLRNVSTSLRPGRFASRAMRPPGTRRGRRCKRQFPGDADRHRRCDVFPRPRPRGGAGGGHRQRDLAGASHRWCAFEARRRVWPGEGRTPPRIFFMAGRRLIALDAKTGAAARLRTKRRD